MIPNGGPGIENRLHMLYTHGVRPGRISMNRFVELTSTNPAKLFGLYPAQGHDRSRLRRRHRRVGSGEGADDLGGDAPLERQLQPVRGRPQVTGAPEVVLVRGQVIVENDELVGSPATASS